MKKVIIICGVIGIIAVVILIMFTGSGNNTEIVRKNFDASACKKQKPFETALAALKEISKNAPPPTACTLFVITPIHTSPNPNNLTGSISQSSVNLRDLVMPLKLEKVSLIALEFVSLPLTTSNFTVNMPKSLSLNPLFSYGFHIPCIFTSDTLWCDSPFDQFPHEQPVISSSNGQKDIEFVYTSDGGQTWSFFRDDNAEDLKPST